MVHADIPVGATFGWCDAADLVDDLGVDIGTDLVNDLGTDLVDSHMVTATFRCAIG